MGSSKAMSIISDTTVGSVNVAAFDSLSHELLGRGTRSKKVTIVTGADQ
jgi:hypothetical protein